MDVKASNIKQNLMIPPFLPSLQHIAAVKIAVSLYNNKDIQGMAEEMENYFTIDTAPLNLNRHEGWEKIRKEAIEKIQSIVPNSLQNTVTVLLRPLHREFVNWIRDHVFVYITTLDDSYKNDIYWASNGKINRIKTAKLFIRNKSHLCYGRFLMACTNFLENEILTLWNEMEDEIIDVSDTNLSVRFWVKWLKQGASTPLSQMVEELKKYAPVRPMDARIRLSSFFDILSRENRQEFVKRLDSETAHEDDLRSCMHYMDEKERVEFLTTDSEGVLCSLLEWPFQNEFLLTANVLWPFLTPNSFHRVLQTLVFAYVLKDFKYFDYFHLLKEFWKASPVSLRSNKQEKLFQFVEKVLSCDTESSPLTAYEIEKECRSFFPECYYQA